MFPDDPTVLTARVAMALYASAIAMLLTSFRRRLPVARWLYAAGCVVFIIHVLSAFHWRHSWSHVEAADAVRKDTAALTGVASAFGLWLNYLFTGVWSADAAWWWSAGDRRYVGRRRWITAALHGFLLFMAFNAVVVFPRGPTQWVGIGVAVVLIAIGFKRWRVARTCTHVRG